MMICKADFEDLFPEIFKPEVKRQTVVDRVAQRPAVTGQRAATARDARPTREPVEA